MGVPVDALGLRFGDTVDLVEVENDEFPGHDSDLGLGFVFFPHRFDGHGLVEHTVRPVLAFADLAAQSGRLAVREPLRGGESEPLGFCPQDQDVDAAVALAGRVVRRERLVGVPWLLPWLHAAFQVGND